MQRQRVRLDVVLGHRFGDQLLSQFGGFPQGDHPADDIAAENIQDHIQVETGPFGRALSLVISQFQTWLGAVARSSGLV